jgi:LysR family transcriptional regulator, nod-box dependent transcriptional activator
MRFKGLDLNLLVALDVLLAQKNISQAADSVNLSQSGMSGALARLREYFQDDLLVLVGRNLILTPLAESLVIPVREVLMSIDSTIVTRPTFDPATDERTYRILVSELTMLLLIPAVVRRLAQDAPHIKIELLAQHAPQEMLERGEADLMLIPEQFLAPEHPSRKLYEESYECVVWSENTRFGDTISFEEYIEAGHVTVQHGAHHAPAFDGWFLNQYGVSRKAEVVTSNLTFPPLLVVGTQRIATVHRRLATRVADYLPIRILTPPINIPPLQQMLQWHKNRSSDPGLMWMCEVLAEEASKV